MVEDTSFYRLLIEEIDDPVGIVDKNMVIQYRSPSYEKVFAFHPEELIGTHVLDHLQEEDRKQYSRIFGELLAKGPGSVGHVLVRMTCKDGHDASIRISMKNLLDTERINGILETYIRIPDLESTNRQVQEEIEKSRALIESTDDMIWVVDPINFGLIMFNSSLIHYFKTGRSLDITRGMTPTDLLPPEYAIVWEHMYEKVLSQGAYRIDYETSANKRILNLSFNEVKISGETIGISVFGQDITERKLTEKALETANRNFDTALKNSLIGIVIVDKNKKIRWSNPSAMTMMQLKENEIIGKFCTDIFCTAAPEKCPILDDGLKVDNSERMLKCGGGKEIFIIKSVSPIEMNGEELLMETFVDISERKKIEYELRTSLTQNKRILENLQDAYFQTDLQGTFTVINPKALSLYGFVSLDTLVGQPADILFADSEDMKKLIRRLRHDGSVNDYNCKTLRADGTTFWVSMNVQFVKNEEGKIIGTEGLVRDISDRMEYENEIRNNRDNLRVLNERLEKMLEQSVHAISKIGELKDLYTAGHQRRVEKLACAIAKSLGFSPLDLVNLSFGALIHDIGKVYIPSDILNKPGKITDLEVQILQTHVEQSYNVAKEIDFPWQVAEMIHQHHERLDGTGYPLGLSGDDIILEARILAVADVVESMTSHRPYRASLGIEAAMQEIENFKGSKFDPLVVDACMKVVTEKDFSWD